MHRPDAIVAGSGPSALAAAALLARESVSTTLIGPQGTNESDPRTIALMQPSIGILHYLGLWPNPLARIAQPLRRLRIIDDTGSGVSSQTVTFSCDELGLDAFGWNIRVAPLTLALRDLCLSSGVSYRSGRIDSVAVAEDVVTVRCDDSSIFAASIIVAADGRESLVRRSLAIAAEEWTYEQTAIATTFAHSVPHDDLSIEHHRPAGPLTTVPLPHNRSGLVWMERPDVANELMHLDEGDFACELQAAIHGQLGRVLAIGTRAAFAMRGLLAPDFGGPRALLVGEAAHVVPPLGAQGLNMSFRDAAAAAKLIGDACRKGRDPGAGDLVRSYAEVRRRDVVPRQSIIHAINLSLLSGFLPISAARAFGMAAIDQLAPLRKLAMNQGVGSYPAPSL
jgi:2-octaprenyl-6-methoxyphenol hydroxylase